MTTLHIDLRVLSGIDPETIPAVAEAWMRPHRAYHVEDGSEDYLLGTDILKVKLVDGKADVVLPPTPAGNALSIQLRRIKGFGQPFLVAIPASGTVNLGDLPHLDPTTLDPEAPLDPAWVAGLEAVQDELGEKVNTSTYAAGLAGKVGSTELAGKVGVTFDDLPTDGSGWSAHQAAGQWDYSPIGPPNTIAGGELSLALGASILDFDVRTTRDGVLTIMHDATIDATTAGTGSVSTLALHQISKVASSRRLGSGWDNQPVPSMEDVLRRFGGRCVLTFEAKDGISQVVPMAKLIKRYRLEKSVLINTNSGTVADAIRAEGILLHQFSVTDTTMLGQAAARGASLIELGASPGSTLVTAALASGIPRVYAGLTSTRTMRANLDARLHGFVSDGPGYVDKAPTTRLANNIIGATATNRRGHGWRAGAFGNNPVVTNGAIPFTGGTARQLYLGELCGSMPTTGSIGIKVRIGATAISTGAASTLTLRALATTPDTLGQDSDTNGYVFRLFGTGFCQAWTSSPTFGSATTIGNMSTTTLVAGAIIELRIDWTPTGVTFRRVDTGQSITAGSTNTDWRGGQIYLFGSATADYEVTEVYTPAL